MAGKMMMDILSGKTKTKKTKTINIKPSHRGLLHKTLGVPMGQKLTDAQIAKAAKSTDPAVRKRALFAQNFRH